MLPSYERPQFSQVPILLSNQEIDQPYKVLEEFVEDYSPGEIRRLIEEQVTACLTTDNAAFASPGRRADLMHTSDRMARVLEAIFVIVREKKSHGIFIAS